MSTNEAAERLEEFLAEISNDQPSDALRDLADALAHERSAGAAPLDHDVLRQVYEDGMRAGFIAGQAGRDFEASLAEVNTLVEDTDTGAMAAVVRYFARFSEGTDR